MAQECRGYILNYAGEAGEVIQLFCGSNGSRYGESRYVGSIVLLQCWTLIQSRIWLNPVMVRDSRKHSKNGKNMADFCENYKNHGTDTASNHGPKDHYAVYKTQHLALTTITISKARFSSVKFCHCAVLKYIFLRWRYTHILSQKITKHVDFGSRGKGKYFCVKITQ